jgi:hypothetical protein
MSCEAGKLPMVEFLLEKFVTHFVVLSLSVSVFGIVVVELTLTG